MLLLQHSDLLNPMRLGSAPHMYKFLALIRSASLFGQRYADVRLACSRTSCLAGMEEAGRFAFGHANNRN